MLDPEVESLLGPDPARQVAIAGGAYDGASRFNRDIALWCPPIQSADRDILPEKVFADARSRDVLRNDSYVMGGANLHRDGIVGAMFVLNARPEFKILGLDETWAEEFQEECESKFTLLAESPMNWLDASRMNTLTSMVRMVVGVFVATGEVLGSVEWLRDAGRPFSTAIQMIELDRLSNPPGMMPSPRLRGGVQRNRYGAPVGYHIQMAHPGDHDDPNVWRWRYVPVRKPWGRLQMIHIIEQGRPNQTRGMAEMVSALKELKIAKKFRDIVLQNAVINATYAASIESELPPEAVYQQLGSGNVGEGVSAYGAAYLGAIAEYIGDKGHMQLDGVKIPHLFPGTKLNLHPAGQGGPLGTEFESSLLRYFAANLGVSYEELSRDYSQTNYSSIRAAMNNTWKHLAARKRMVADKFATIVYRLWMEEAINKGQIDSLPAKFRSNPGWFYEGLNAEAVTACEWIGASRGQIDELKETQAAVLRLKYHLSTYEEENARMGKDWRKTFAQRSREVKEMEARNLQTPESVKDEMMNAATGVSREKEAKGEKDDGSEDNTDV